LIASRSGYQKQDELELAPQPHPTYATIAPMAGRRPRYVQEYLGYASVSITLDTYSHVIAGMDGGLADATDEALWDLLLTYC
jgi:hypothetical protein